MNIRNTVAYVAGSLLVLGALSTGCANVQNPAPKSVVREPVPVVKKPKSDKTPMAFGSVCSEKQKIISAYGWNVYIKNINGHGRDDSYAVDPSGTYHLMNLDNSRMFENYTVWRCKDGTTELVIHLETGETREYGVLPIRYYVVNGGKESFRFREGQGYNSINEMLQRR